MTSRSPTGLVASIRQRLLDLAVRTGDDYFRNFIKKSASSGLTTYSVWVLSKLR